MQKDKSINVSLVLFSLLGVAVAYTLGELLLRYFGYLPDFVQAGCWLTIMAAVGGVMLLVSETVATGGYVSNWKQIFYKDSIKALLICLPIIFVLGMGTQWLYGLLGVRIGSRTAQFQGTMLISDVSGSMQDNDPERKAVTSMCDYIDSVPLGEYLGVIVFNHEYQTLRPYAVLETEEERTLLKTLLYDSVDYNGGTDTESALLEGIQQVRTAAGDYPGLILLFSDGLCEVDYNAIQASARGNVNNNGDQIPVNTIYYASNLAGGYQMSRIAQSTGGKYYYLSDQTVIADMFKTSRSLYTVERPHLLLPCFGALRSNPVRVLLQIGFLSLWGIALGAMVLMMLDVKHLVRAFFYPRILLSVVFTVMFALLMNTVSVDATATIRLIPAFVLLFLPLPTYKSV